MGEPGTGSVADRCHVLSDLGINCDALAVLAIGCAGRLAVESFALDTDDIEWLLAINWLRER